MEAFPLYWPDGYERTPAREKKDSAFKCTVAQARDGVLKQIDLLNGLNPIISSNVPVKQNGQMYGSNKTVDGDNGIAVYFTWDNEQYVLACDQYNALQDNLRAIEKSIDALRGLKRWGASDILKKAFTGFKALPEHGKKWWEVLNVEKDSPILIVKEAYRLLAKKYHPDNRETGDNDKFIEVQKAMDQYLNSGVTNAQITY